MVERQEKSKATVESEAKQARSVEIDEKAVEQPAERQEVASLPKPQKERKPLRNLLLAIGGAAFIGLTAYEFLSSSNTTAPAPVPTVSAPVEEAQPVAQVEESGGVRVRVNSNPFVHSAFKSGHEFFMTQRVGEGDDYTPYPYGVVPVLIDVDRSHVVFDYSRAGSGPFATSSFNGYILDFSGQGGNDCLIITEANLSSTDIPITADRIQISGSEMRVNVSGYNYTPSSSIRLDIVTAPCG